MSEKRITMTLAEKKRYAEMIGKRAKKEVINRFFRQKHGQDIPKRTFSRLKNESKKILESTSKNKVRQKFKKSESMLKFEEKIKEEYAKRRMKSRVRGVTNFIRKIMNEHFADNEEIQRLQLSTELVTRIIRDCGKKHQRRPTEFTFPKRKRFSKFNGCELVEQNILCLLYSIWTKRA